MGFFSSAVVQTVVSFVVLGTLKRMGIVKVDLKAIENPSARSLFGQGVDLGESVAVTFERVMKEFTRK